MNAQMVLTMGQEALLMLLMVSFPVLGAALVVGLLVSLFQAVTQIHEATLAFVPKLVAVIAVFAIAGPWMLTTLVEFVQRTLQAIVQRHLASAARVAILDLHTGLGDFGHGELIALQVGAELLEATPDDGREGHRFERIGVGHVGDA